MSTRDDILARVRSKQPAPQPLPDVPLFKADPRPLLEQFKAGLVRMGGKFVDSAGAGDADAVVRRLFPDAKVICSATPEVTGNRLLATVGSPADLDDVDVGVVRAAFGVAETGSVWLTDTAFGVSALGFLSQHLVVLLDTERLLPGLQQAYRQRQWFDARYGVFLTGPSATADIEGVLIHGAQGVRSLTVIGMPA
jgi:L-lactate dehydrogenase complex protein LldG